jgi:hypothetical protein
MTSLIDFLEPGQRASRVASQEKGASLLPENREIVRERQNKWKKSVRAAKAKGNIFPAHFIRFAGEKSMAVYVLKYINREAGVIPNGVAVTFSANGFYMYVRDAQGVEIAKFQSRAVKHYWIEASPVSSLADTVDQIA